MNDSEVVKAVRAGNHQSFGALVERYRDLVYRFCYRMTENIPDAEDLASWNAICKHSNSLQHFEEDNR